MLFVMGQEGLGHKIRSPPLANFATSDFRFCLLAKHQKSFRVPTRAKKFARLWARRDSNPHALRQSILSRSRIPIPPLAHARIHNITFSVYFKISVLGFWDIINLYDISYRIVIRCYRKGRSIFCSSNSLRLCYGVIDWKSN